MNNAYRKLGEDLPARSDTRGLTVPTDPKRLRGWIDALPRANPALTQRQLGDALTALNGVRLARGQRLPLLELLRPAIVESVRPLARQLQGATLPLPAAKLRQVEQLQAVDRDLAIGYRLALLELCGPQGKVPLFRAAAVATAAARALAHQSRLLAHAYALYQAPPEGAWLALHRLYGFAADVRVDARKAPDPLAEAGSPRQSYVQAVLLALSNPYRFSQKEQAELFALTHRFAALVELGTRPGDGRLAVPQDSDEGPGYLPEERADEHGDMRWLDVAPLQRALAGPLQDRSAGPVVVRLPGGAVESSAELLRRLQAGWGSAAARSHQRMSAGHVLDTVIGLSGVHFHLAHGADFDAFLRRAGVGASAGDGDRHEWAHASVDAGRVPVQQAEVLDQSLGGYRVRWSSEQHLRARVGELIGLRIGGDDEGGWMLGVVRWLRYAGDGSVDGGIELLARRARAVAVRSTGPGEARPRLRGIQYAPVRGDSRAELNLVVPGVFELAGGEIEIMRVDDPAALDAEEPARERCRRVQMVERAAEHVLLRAERSEAREAA